MLTATLEDREHQLQEKTQSDVTKPDAEDGNLRTDIIIRPNYRLQHGTERREYQRTHNQCTKLYKKVEVFEGLLNLLNGLNLADF